MVDGKLVDLGREPRDVMVVVETEAEGPGRVRIHDGEGEFLGTVLLTTEQPGSSSEEDAHATASIAVESDDRSRDREAALAAERDRLAADVERYRTELESSRADLERTKNEVDGVKRRLKEVWRMNCDQNISYDEELATKDAEIAELKRRLSAAPGMLPHSDFIDHAVDAHESRPRHSPTVGGPRRGKAPPVDAFSDGVFCFDDWLPSLERAAAWNAWAEPQHQDREAWRNSWRASTVLRLWWY